MAVDYPGDENSPNRVNNLTNGVNGVKKVEKAGLDNVQFSGSEAAKDAAGGDDKKEEKKPEDEVPPITFGQMYKYSTRNDKLMIFMAVISAIVTGLATPANTLIFGRLIDAMVSQAQGMFPGTTDQPFGTTDQPPVPFEIDMTQIFLDEIQFFAIFNSVIGIIMFVFSYLATMLFNYSAHNQIYTIRDRFMRSVLNQDIGWYDINKSGEFASRINEDLTKFEDGLGEKVGIFIMFQVAFVSSIIVAFVKGWLLALVCLVSLPVTLLSVGIVGYFTSKLSKKEVEAYAIAGGIAEEAFGAIRTVVAFGGQLMELTRYSKKLVDAREINIKKNMLMGIGFGLLWFFIYASYSLAFWYGIGLIIDDRHLPPEEQTYSVGTFFIVFMSVMMAGMNLGISTPYIESITVARGAGAKVFHVIDQKPKIDPLSEKGLKPASLKGNIAFSGVHFNYPSRTDVKVLQGLDLDIKRGQTVALVGSSGCGKSTTIQLIQRFYDVDQGSVTVDGVDIKELNVNWLRSKIGVVGQEPVLFGTTIYENIRYGFDAATKEQIEQAAKAANAHNFIKSLPDGYETLVGERGAQMSGGQKQRIAIARALVRDPEILLLDEATSALDTASEAKVQRALEKAAQGRTTIIVAHRLSTIRNADKIFVFHEGRIVEIGSHRELMEKRGKYYALVTTQVGLDMPDEKAKEKVAVQESVEEEDDSEEKIDIAKDSGAEETGSGKMISVFQVMQWNKTEWPYITIGSISSIIMGAAMPLFALIFGRVIGVFQYEDSDMVRSEANTYSLYFLITGIVVGFATFLQIFTYGKAGEILTERLRGRAFGAMLKQEIAWFDDKSNGVGALCSKLSSDAASVQGATGQRIGTLLQSVATIVIALGIAMVYEWRLALVALAFTPIILVASYMEMRLMEQQNMGNSKALEKSTKLAVEVVSNIRTVVSLGREKMFHQQYMDFLAPSLKTAKKNTHFRGLVYGVARSIMYFAFAVCMLYGGNLVANEGVDYADVFVVTQALIMGTLSISSAFAYAPNFQKGLIAAGKMNDLFERKPRIQDAPHASDRPWQAHGSINFYDVHFHYPSRQSSKVLQGLNLDAYQGQTIALVGPSGCGKSTCIQLLERFYDATDGYVAIDSKKVTDVTLKNLRHQMGIVSQEPSLFARTISENIAYGDNEREVPQAEIIQAAKKANIHNFITSLPLGYNTPLGDKGTQLSGGQKQRVAIARALIRNPRILLLDEATSALDMESEKVVQEALDAAQEGRTCVTIAHRLTTIVDADVIFVIEKGQVAEKGSHKELLEKKGLYHALYTLQAHGS